MRYVKFLLLALFAITPQVMAKTRVNLYQIDVPIAQQAGEAEQQKALELGLIDVLKKATGNPGVESSEVIQKATSNLDEYLQSYNISEQDANNTLHIEFIPEKIQSLISDAGFDVWPEMRKKVLVWMLDQSASEDEAIAWDLSDLAISAQLKTQASRAGIPVLYPVGDFQDATSVSASDISGHFIDNIANASTRYSADAILVVNRKQDETGEVNLSWRLYDQKPANLAQQAKLPQEGESLGANNAEAFADMMSQMSGYFVNHSTAKKQNAPVVDSFVGHFNGIDKVRDIVDIQNYLKEFTSVGSVQVSGLKGRSVALSINLIDSRAQFEQEINASRHFRPTTEPNFEVAQTNSTQADQPKVLGEDMANNEAAVLAQSTQSAAVSVVENDDAVAEDVEAAWYQYSN